MKIGETWWKIVKNNPQIFSSFTTSTPSWRTHWNCSSRSFPAKNLTYFHCIYKLSIFLAFSMESQLKRRPRLYVIFPKSYVIFSIIFFKSPNLTPNFCFHIFLNWEYPNGFINFSMFPHFEWLCNSLWKKIGSGWLLCSFYFEK